MERDDNIFLETRWTKLLSRIEREVCDRYQIEVVPSYAVRQLRTAFNKFHGELMGKKILDLGCGAIGGDNLGLGVKRSRQFEPWFCRLLLAAGAIPVGVDRERLHSEGFESHQMDLSNPAVLSFFQDKFFDGVNMRLLLSSPTFNKRTPPKNKQRKIVRDFLVQIRRLLKDDGKVIELTRNF